VESLQFNLFGSQRGSNALNEGNLFDDIYTQFEIAFLFYWLLLSCQGSLELIHGTGGVMKTEFMKTEFSLSLALTLHI
jgi:hypothetical protein